MFERLEAGQGYHTLAATAYQRSGGLAYWAEAGDYVVAVDNRLEGRGPADVRLRVWLVFESPAAPPRTLSPERRAVVEAAGIRDILTKSLGSSNVLNVVKATFLALEQLKFPEQEAQRRGKPVKDLLPFWERRKNG